jgi:hypothetical protein
MAGEVKEVQGDETTVKLDDSEASKGQEHLDFIDKLEADEEEELKDGKVQDESDKEASKEGSGKEEVAPKDEEKPEPDEKEEEIRTLRQIARDQKREIDKITKALEETNKVLKDAQIISPEDVDKKRELDEFAARRQEQLEDLLEVMKVNPKFEDVDEVVSQEHFDDMVEAMGRAIIAKEGGKLDDVVKNIEAEVWAMKNPYKFMYENIKRYHPDYKAAPAKGDGDGKVADEKKSEDKSEKKEEKKVEKKEMTLEKVASSIQDIGGGSSGTGGWTAARIDDLEETELDQVPKDIYDKYLRNELK